MQEARRDDPELTVVQAHRFELIDDAGRVRAILGDVSDTRTYVPGLALLDREGNRRADFAFQPSGPTLIFTVSGNEVLILAVNDDELREDAEGYAPRTFLALCDGEGAPSVSFTVCHDGARGVSWGGISG